MLYFIVQLIFVGIWFAGAGCVYGMNDFKYDPHFDNIGQGRLPVWKTGVIIMLAIKLFAILWVLFFVNLKISFITMVAASTYYFTSNEKEDGHADVGIGFKWAYGANMGSIALGSLI